MDDLLKRLSRIGIVPVVTIHNADLAENLAQALYKGGLPCAEITFRTEAAAEAIKKHSPNKMNIPIPGRRVTLPPSFTTIYPTRARINENTIRVIRNENISFLTIFE